MERFEYILETIIIILNIFSILVLLWGVLNAVKHFVVARITNKTKMDVIRENTVTRNALGSYILLSLEILIAADIIATILDPSKEEMLILGVVVVIRTLISFFLNKEIKDADVEQYSGSTSIKKRLKEK